MPVTDAIQRDLRVIADQARWAYTHGLWKAGNGLTAERGQVLKPVTPEVAAERRNNPDHVGGAKHDIGVGDHRAREAYELACDTVIFTFATLVALLYGLERPVVSCWYLTPSRFAVVVDRSVRLAQQVRVEGNERALDDVRVRLSRCVAALDKAVGSQVEVDQGARKGLAPDRLCSNCKQRVRKYATGRCSVCERWSERHQGQNRPTHLDGISPLEAQQKRLRQGVGWGAG